LRFVSVGIGGSTIYARIARQLRIDPSLVSRVANVRARNSEKIMEALESPSLSQGRTSIANKHAEICY